MVKRITREKPLREGVSGVFTRPRSPRWSRWYVALAPDGISKKYEKRENGHKGFIYSGIKNQFTENNYGNGIYEMRSSKGENHYVVYVGKAHRKDPGALGERIKEYLNDGSHLYKLINMAINRGYKLSFRAKDVRGDEEAVEEMEEDLLERFEYAWNKQLNGPVRRNVPPIVQVI